jgi:hypothetical protein
MYYFIKYIVSSILFFVIYLLNSFGQEVNYKVVDLKNHTISASRFSIDKEGNLFILDSENNKLIKYDSEGKFTKEIGGWGWGNLNFDKPVSVDATDGLNVYVSDYYNHRILRYNKQLEYISTLFTRFNDDVKSRFGFPTVIAVDQFSNLFLYENENKRLLKFDQNGNVDRSFGGYESVSVKITDPLKIEVNYENNLFVLEKGNVYIFDNWGTSSGIVKLDSGKIVKNFCIQKDKIYILPDKSEIITVDMDGHLINKYDLNKLFVELNFGEIQDINLFIDNIYLLNKNSIIILSM